jgi:hypothetical protein
MKVYILIDLSRWSVPVRRVYSCAVDAAEACKKFPNCMVVDYLVNSGEDPERRESERSTSTCPSVQVWQRAAS